MVSATVKRKQLIKNYPEKLNEVNRQFLPAAGVLITGEVKRRVDIGDGTLRSSVSFKVMKDIVKIFSNLLYAIFREYGTGIYAEGGGGRKTPWVYYNDKADHFVTTKGSPAHPAFRPGLDENRKKLVSLWKENFRRVYGR